MSIYLDHNATSPMHAPAIDALSFSAHRLGGPREIGVPVAGRKPRAVSIGGGGQESKHRGGTENLADIVGPGKAARLARLEIEHSQLNLGQLRKLFESRLTDTRQHPRAQRDQGRLRHGKQYTGCRKTGLEARATGRQLTRRGASRGGLRE